MAKVDMKKLRNRMKSRKSHYESNYQPKHKDISKFIAPERGRFDDESIPDDGKNRFTELVDHTAGLMASKLAAALFEGLSSPMRDWFRFQTKKPELMELAPVKAHFEAINRVMKQALHDTNAYNSLGDIYEEIVLFGTAAMFVDRDPIDDFRVHTFTAGEYYISADSAGRVDKLYRRYSQTVDNVIDKFGAKNVSAATNAAAQEMGSTFINIVHAIEPNKGRDVTLDDNLNMPIRSVYYEEGTRDDDKPLRVSGYKKPPIIVGRYRTVGSEIYGQSPSNRALGISKTLQEAVKDLWRASKKTIAPPINRPTQLKGKKLGPGTANHYDGAKGAPQVSAIYQIKYDMNGNLTASEQIREAISKIFNSDLFAALATVDRSGKMTATEVSQRVAEAVRMLVAVITRMNSEILKPFLELIYNMLDEDGKFPEPPEELDEEEIDTIFISSLALAQQAVGIAGIEQVLDFVTRSMQVDPSIADKWNGDQAVDNIVRMTGAPSNSVRTDEEVAQIRKVRDQKEQQAATAAVMSQMADGAQKLGNTPMGTGSALDTVVEGVSGAT